MPPRDRPTANKRAPSGRAARMVAATVVTSLLLAPWNGTPDARGQPNPRQIENIPIETPRWAYCTGESAADHHMAVEAERVGVRDQVHHISLATAASQAGQDQQNTRRITVHLRTNNKSPKIIQDESNWFCFIQGVFGGRRKVHSNCFVEDIGSI